MLTAVYPGSFDPITNGHIDLIKRASTLFDQVIIGIAQNTGKSAFLPLDTRVAMVNSVLSDLNNVHVKCFDNLLVDFARENQANVILRGLRAVSDFEYEFQLCGMNKKLSPTIETMFMASAEQYHHISSSLVREIACLGGEIDAFVPPLVKEAVLSYAARQAK